MVNKNNFCRLLKRLWGVLVPLLAWGCQSKQQERKFPLKWASDLVSDVSYESSSICTIKGGMVSFVVIPCLPLIFQSEKGQVVGNPTSNPSFCVCFVFMNWRTVPTNKGDSVLKPSWGIGECSKCIYREPAIFFWQLKCLIFFYLTSFEGLCNHEFGVVITHSRIPFSILATFIAAMQEMGAVYQHCLKIN